MSFALEDNYGSKCIILEINFGLGKINNTIHLVVSVAFIFEIQGRLLLNSMV